MGTRLLILTLPSAVILTLLVVHSLSSLPRWRALAFWGTAALYGILRGAAVRLITERGLEGSAPYVVHEPGLAIFGISLQEVVGWAIVSYLAWWLGQRFSESLPEPATRVTLTEVRRDLGGPASRPPPRLYPQILWGCLFLGSVSWTVEAAASAASWWHWTIPARSGLLGNVPFIGLGDWFFVGTDFLLPFVLLTSDARPRAVSRFWVLALFPVHFAAHLIPWRLGAIPIPIFHLVHWGLLFGVVIASLVSKTRESAFVDPRGRARRLLPVLATMAVLAVAGLVHLLWGHPSRMVSLLPVLAMLAGSFSDLGGILVGAAGVLAIVAQPGAALAAVPAALAWTFRKLRSPASRRLASAGAASALLAAALLVHTHTARRDAELREGLDGALSLRNAGDIEGARRALASLAFRFPESHAVQGFLGEIEYRTHHTEEARAAFREAIDIKPDFLMGRRYLVVMALEEGDRATALAEARAGLRIDPSDLELRYLEARAASASTDRLIADALSAGPQPSRGLAALAYEVGDIESAVRLIDRALETWPDDPSFYELRSSLALVQHDDQKARTIALEWRRRLPADPRAADLARRLGLP